MEVLIYGKNGCKALRHLHSVYDPINMYLFRSFNNFLQISRRERGKEII